MRLILTVLSLAILTAGCGRRNNGPLDTGPQISRADILSQHNHQRAINGNLPPLARDPVLEDRAQKWAEVMALRDSLTHSHLDMGGTKFMTMGENIAMGFADTDSVVHGWMNSRGHRQNILNPRFTKAGFGYAKRQNGSAYWCAQFGGN